MRAVEAAATPRWVFNDATLWLPELLTAGVRIARCHDLRLSHAILARSELVTERGDIAAADSWLAPPFDPDPEPAGAALFELEEPRDGGVPWEAREVLAEFGRQRAAIASATDPARLGVLIAAESAGALIAEELRFAGVPWDTREHERILVDALGPRPAFGARPAKMAALAVVIGEVLGDANLSIDSPPKVLRALRAAGIDVQSTSKWELQEIEHPVIAPLLEYKKLARLLTANGWTWIDEWVRDGRYHPVYVPGGVVTGRWAANGGGALQLPRQLRQAVRADEGWTLVSADVAQLEPRVLAAMSGDRAMAAAGRSKDLYEGIVTSRIVETRQEAKIAVLGAMYGATTGDSGRLVPRLRRGFPAAMRLVDDAARVGERGGVVSTWLGRSSPAPEPEWREFQSLAAQVDASERLAREAGRAAREFGRFTRNFVVQGTAAEWALAWLGELRMRLAAIGGGLETPITHSPHLAFFLHDEVIVHTPVEFAERVAEAVAASAASAGRLLFGDTPVDFPLDVRVSRRAEKG